MTTTQSVTASSPEISIKRTALQAELASLNTKYSSAAAAQLTAAPKNPETGLRENQTEYQTAQAECRRLLSCIAAVKRQIASLKFSTRDADYVARNDLTAKHAELLRYKEACQANLAAARNAPAENATAAGSAARILEAENKLRDVEAAIVKVEAEMQVLSNGRQTLARAQTLGTGWI